MKKLTYKEIIEIGCRLYVSFFLAFYGLGKILGAQFYTPDLIPAELETMPISQIPNFDLAWVFMGRSYSYMLFIGIGELLGALMLLFNKTKLIGTLILIPIMVNVVVFDIFFLDEYGALASAIIYFIMILVILWINKEKIMKVIQALTLFETVTKTSIKEKFVKYSIILMIFVVIFVFNQLLVNWFGYGKG